MSGGDQQPREILMLFMKRKISIKMLGTSSSAWDTQSSHLHFHLMSQSVTDSLVSRDLFSLHY